MSALAAISLMISSSAINTTHGSPPVAAVNRSATWCSSSGSRLPLQHVSASATEDLLSSDRLRCASCRGSVRSGLGGAGCPSLRAIQAHPVRAATWLGQFLPMQHFIDVVQCGSEEQRLRIDGEARPLALESIEKLGRNIMNQDEVGD
jgi:hypothetical protein